MALLITACIKHQYKGGHIKKAHAERLKEEQEGFHLNEAQEIIAEKQENKTKYEKRKEKRNKAITKSLNDHNKKKNKHTKKSRDFDYYM
jgi:hypothetical protein